MPNLPKRNAKEPGGVWETLGDAGVLPDNLPADGYRCGGTIDAPVWCEWLPETVDSYQRLLNAPHAKHLHAHHWPAVHRLAILWDVFLRDPHGSKVLTELGRLEREFGLTWAEGRRQRLEFKGASGSHLAPVTELSRGGADRPVVLDE